MAIPMTILEIELLIALLGTVYLWFGNDTNNFTHLISIFVCGKNNLFIY